MITCEEFFAEFADYLENQVSPEVRQELELHLAQCRACQVLCDTSRKTVQIVTGDYELTGKSRGASTARRTIGGAAVGSIIGALAGGGEGAAIGAGVVAGAGAGSETITKGDQVRVPSETLIEFTLQQDVSIPTSRN